MITTLHYIGENVHTLCGETFIKVFKKFNDSHLFILRQICINVYHTYYSVKDNKIPVKCLFYINIDTDGDITQQT